MKATLSNASKPDEQVVFEVPPQKINRKFESSYNKLTVLATAQPLLWYQQSSTSMTLPSLLIYGAETGKSLSLLESWTKPDDSLEPPTLKFDFVHLHLPRCKLESVEVIEDMWIGGASPTRAEVTLTLLLHPEQPEVKTAPTIAQTGTNVKLTDAEKQKYLAQVLPKVQADKKYQYKAGDKLAIDDTMQVTLNDKPIGKLTDFVTLEKKHTTPVGVEPPNQSKGYPTVKEGKSTSKV